MHFYSNYSEIFATGSKNDIRLWHLESQKELLRITVPNFVCTSLCFFYDGKLILSGKISISFFLRNTYCFTYAKRKDKNYFFLQSIWACQKSNNLVKKNFKAKRRK